MLLMIVEFDMWKFCLRISQGLRAVRCDPPHLPGNFHSDKDTWDITPQLNYLEYLVKTLIVESEYIKLNGIVN
jgi:hypothetical protein